MTKDSTPPATPPAMMDCKGVTAGFRAGAIFIVAPMAFHSKFPHPAWCTKSSHDKCALLEAGCLLGQLQIAVADRSAGGGASLPRCVRRATPAGRICGLVFKERAAKWPWTRNNSSSTHWY